MSIGIRSLASHWKIHPKRAMDTNAPIAVFDSGLGGISVLRRLVREVPGESFLYFGDSANAPYGSKSTEQIRELTLAHGERFFARGAKALVVACNTATSAAIDDLRETYPHKIIIGIEPALKPAVDHYAGGTVLVMATDATLRERKFAALMEKYAGHSRICTCPCPELMGYVERGELEGSAVEGYLRMLLSSHLAHEPDAVVLGCTHYPFLKKAIRSVLGERPEFFDGADGTAKECKRRLEEAGLLRQEGSGQVTIVNSSNDPLMTERASFLLTLPEL